jgi:hypothetical protein
MSSIVVAMMLAGCPKPGGSVNEPEKVLKEYAAALKKGDHDRAYALMSAKFRETHTREDFDRLLREHKIEVDQAADQLKTQPKKVMLEARIDYGEGETLKLVKDKGSWHIAQNPVDFYGQRTPAEALRSFVRAIERHRYDVVMRFVPNKWAEVMTVEKLRDQWEGGKKDEVKGLLKNLKANLSAAIHVAGNTATMPYGDRFEVRFIREDGVWKIEDPD